MRLRHRSFQGLREYAARKGVTLTEVWDALAGLVTPAKPGASLPSDPFPELGVPLGSDPDAVYEHVKLDYRRRRGPRKRAA